jgi:hypothetical protein
MSLVTRSHRIEANTSLLLCSRTVFFSGSLVLSDGVTYAYLYENTLDANLTSFHSQLGWVGRQLSARLSARASYDDIAPRSVRDSLAATSPTESRPPCKAPLVVTSRQACLDCQPIIVGTKYGFVGRRDTQHISRWPVKGTTGAEVAGEGPGTTAIHENAQCESSETGVFDFPRCKGR